VDLLPDLRSTKGIYLKSLLSGYQYMMWQNMRRSPLDDVNVRKAVDIALDRDAMSQALRGGQATRSFFPQASPYYVKDEHLHSQKDEAAKLLDDAGWTLVDGKRQKGGTPLKLTSYAYPQRAGLPPLQEEMVKQLGAVGIEVDASVKGGTDWNELGDKINTRDFDLLFWAQHTLPSGDPQGFLNMFFKTDEPPVDGKYSGNNFGGLKSAKVDGLIDELSSAAPGTARVEATKAAHVAIREQYPVSFLITPAWHVGLGCRLANYQPWGSDYYIINSDFGLTKTQGKCGEDGGAGDTSVNAAPRAMLSGLSVASLLFVAWMF
jgi:peptide/nickel transport system substrate-binding protein